MISLFRNQLILMNKEESSAHRPNPIGLSVLEVVDIFDNVIKVRRIDMFDGTPVLDIKPYIEIQS
ncbi:MAG TPA: SAM-dependent methyltransferase [Thermodesulfovibrio thiophilus]|nr:SAM-dependent methyltransferase [Thermodesulfovibrio thiophilus]